MAGISPVGQDKRSRYIRPVLVDLSSVVHMNKALLYLVPFTLALVGCIDVSTRDAELERLAKQFSELADSCLLDVRDKKLTYSASRNCASLGEASKAYLRPEVEMTYQGKTVPRHAYTAAEARATAWSAAALSNAFHPDQPRTISLW